MELSFLYGDILEGVNVEHLSKGQSNLLVYAITHKKKHFLSVVKENFHDFTYCGWQNLLLDRLGVMLKEKPVSRWIAKELGHVKSLSYQQAVNLLCVWDEVGRFIPEIRTGYHADFLVYNRERLQDIPDFKTVAEQMPEIDRRWKRLNGVLKIGEDFLLKNREGLKRFLCEGGAEIFSAFLSGALDTEKEKARRLCTAEIAGWFREVKYYKNDLEREIVLKLPKEAQQLWMKNMEMKKKQMRLWEEDRLLPVMQIGEVLGHTCLSYRDGEYKSCLLSCFDANKKVVFLSIHGTPVLRAIIRLTKGTFCRIRGKLKGLQFADLTKEDTQEKAENGTKEQLTLFLERPYFKGISEEKEKEAVWLVVEMLKKKAKQLQAELVLSDAYHGFALEEKQFIRAKYYMYISESKNGEQYLDSLGGMAGARQEGSYEKGYFLFQESSVNPKTAKEEQQGGTNGK